MLTGLYLMSSSSSKYSVISWFWPPKYFLIESAELDFFTTRKYNLPSFPNCYFCSDLSSVRRLGESPITQDEGHLDSSQLSLLPPPQGRFLSRLFYPFNSGLHHHSYHSRPLVIILSSCYFGIYNSFSICPTFLCQLYYSLPFQNSLYFPDHMPLPLLFLHSPFLCFSKSIPLFKAQFQWWSVPFSVSITLT